MNFQEFEQKTNEVFASLPEQNREAYRRMVEEFVTQAPHENFYTFDENITHKGNSAHFVGVGVKDKPLFYVESRLSLAFNIIGTVVSILHKPEPKVLTLTDPLGRTVKFKTYAAPQQKLKRF